MQNCHMKVPLNKHRGVRVPILTLAIGKVMKQKRYSPAIGFLPGIRYTISSLKNFFAVSRSFSLNAWIPRM